MLRDQRPDVVHVLVPPNQHHALASASLRSGAHVFLEKPMCTSVEEADDLLRIALDSELKLGVNHNFLYSSAYLTSANDHSIRHDQSTRSYNFQLFL
jgi:predicted dehydrogenase